MSFIRTGLRELGLKLRRQKTRIALQHEKRRLQKSEINLGREGCSRAVNFPEVRNEIVALKKLEQEQKEFAVRIAQIEESIKQIEAQRQANTRAQNAAMAELEEEKKPVLQRRNEAKAASDLCSRELSGVEKRLRENDEADRELLKKLSELHAQVPPPDNLETQSDGINARRVRLPEERAQLTEARMGSAEACRQAKEKLTAAEAELATLEKKIAGVREEFEGKDRALNEKSRAQQEAIREARAHHQTVEERKNPAYLKIGRHLATQGIAPPNAPELLTEVQRHREAVARHEQQKGALAELSSQIDKQELRRFYFSVVSLLVLLAIILPLVFQSPAKREWLPQETEAIFSLNTEQLENDDLPKRWRKEQADSWGVLWPALLGSAAKIPALHPAQDVLRVTRAFTTSESGSIREFVLVEARADISPALRKLEKNDNFEKRLISGLPVWQRADLAVGRVGPRTIAVGRPAEVKELVGVRLGLKEDLKPSTPLLDRFQALSQESSLRLISRDPPNLTRAFPPLFVRQLLDSAQLLGLALTLQNPVKARLIVTLKTPQLATDLAQRLHDEPQRWLRLENSDLLLYSQPPEINRQAETIDLRFNVPENSARMLLQRLAKTADLPMAANK